LKVASERISGSGDEICTIFIRVAGEKICRCAIVAKFMGAVGVLHKPSVCFKVVDCNCHYVFFPVLGVFDYFYLQYNTDLNPCQVLFSFFGSGANDAGGMFFDATVYFVVIKKGDVLSPKETVCEIFDLAEAH
jgi:hypothetical protein